MVQQVSCTCGCIGTDQYPGVCVCFYADRSQQLTDDTLVHIFSYQDLREKYKKEVSILH